jgi:cardiolipin synthase
MLTNSHLISVSIIAFFIEILGILHAIHAIMYARSSHGAIAWAISLVTFPAVTVPLYWMLGRDRFHGYVKTYRTVDVQYHHVIQLTLCDLARRFKAVLPEALTPLQKTANAKALGIPFTSSNTVTLLIDGEQTFKAILTAIQSATNYILIQYYIVRDDDIGNQIKTALIAKAQQNLPIYFIYDEIGSHELSDNYLNELDEAGIQVTSFHSTRGHRFQLNFRNHRKIVVVDGKTAFIGGLNIGDEYLGKCPKYGHWRDTHTMIQGPAVQYVQLAFLKDWYWAVGTLPELTWNATVVPENNATVLILTTGPADELSTCTLFFANMFNLAKSRLWIASPYFVPDEALVTALQLAALRGVDVRILMPDKADHRLVQLASYSYYEEMLCVGIKLYRYQAGFMHQKVVLIDDMMASVGTVNLDNRSFKLNFEMTALVIDHCFVKAVEKMLLEDFTDSRPVNLSEIKDKPLWSQVKVRVSRLMSPLL